MADIYQNPNIETDESELADRAFAYLEDQVDGWEPSGGNLDTWMIEAIAMMASMVAVLAQDVPSTIFRYYGQELIQLAPTGAAEATGTTTWTMKDAAGYTIYDGTELSIGDQTFETTGDVVVPSGSTTAQVPVTCQLEGVVGNDLEDNPQLVVLDPNVLSITLNAPTGDGVDEESEEAYLDRLAERLQLMGTSLVTARDVEIFLLAMFPELARVTVIDNWDPTLSSGSGGAREKALTWVGLTVEGQAPSSFTVGAAARELELNREVNFLFFNRPPVFNQVDISYNAVTEPGKNPAVVEAAANDAVAQWLDPLLWGQPRYGEDTRWVNTKTVRYGELYAVLNGVEGLDYVSSVAINGVYEYDFVMTGIAALPRLNEVDGTVTAP